MIEHELIERCRQGVRSAQHEIYTRTVERVYRLIHRITANEHDATDLAQETYIRAFARAHQFDGRSSFETWLCRIAINLALQNKRRLATERRATSSLDSRMKHLFADSVAPDQRADIEDALASLPQTDRAMLILKYQEGMDYAAIAELTGCAPGTVASRLNRARERVRELLRKNKFGPEENGRAAHQIQRNDDVPIQGTADVPTIRLREGADL